MSRQLLDVPFELAGRLDAARDANGSVLLETPHLRYANTRGLGLNRYGLGPFSRLKIPSLPAAPGVYALFMDDDQLQYVGRARDSLRERWGRRGYSVIDPRNRFVGGQNTNCHVNGLLTSALREGATFHLWFHEIPIPDSLELLLIAGLRPPWNLR
ncbi:hypothetical protein [Phycicoccus sp. Root563]|uniref:hypothetical protein n=1 Tax=Phycicoccus sp. Root563 TaxID=1736562 RepID=UPI000AE938F5|nr:hypothetical protein [Phycicoccus sp. Root563]